MNVAQMVAKVFITLERIGLATLATFDLAREAAFRMRLHMALQLVLSIKQLGRGATRDTAFEDLGWLSTWRDRDDGFADYYN